MDSKSIQHQLEKLLTHGRYQHTLGVVKTAIKIGIIIGLDTEKLRIAALLHDAGKSLRLYEQVKLASDRSIFLTEDDRKAHGVIHSIIGTYLAKTDFGINDKEILDSIRWHTSGRGSMTTFDKIIFAADYLDPYRKLKESRKLLHLTLNNFELGVFEILKRKIKWVIDQGDHLHPLALEFYNKQCDIVKNNI